MIEQQKKVIEKYKKKGIFTIQQLSYLYKPRRKKRYHAKQKISHNIELQSLAIRAEIFFIQQLPELERQPIELFLDIEGNPNNESYYLIGLISLINQDTFIDSFWANNEADELKIWQQFVALVNKYPATPIYHYGNYESKAIDILGKRYKTEVTNIHNRLKNIVNSIYGNTSVALF